MSRFLFRGGVRGEYFVFTPGTGALHSPDGVERWSTTARGVQALMAPGSGVSRLTEKDIVSSSAPRPPFNHLAPKDLPDGRYAVSVQSETNELACLTVVVAGGRAILGMGPGFPPIAIELAFDIPTTEKPFVHAQVGWYSAGLSLGRSGFINGQQQVVDGRVQFLFSYMPGSVIKEYWGVWDPQPAD